MSKTFLAFLIMLAAFLLLTIAAAVRSVWHIFRPSVPTTTARVTKQNQPSRVGDVLLLVGVATAWYSVAGGWGAQFSRSIRFMPTSHHSEPKRSRSSAVDTCHELLSSFFLWA